MSTIAVFDYVCTGARCMAIRISVDRFSTLHDGSDRRYFALKFVISKTCHVDRGDARPLKTFYKRLQSRRIKQ
jgi:nitrate reductase cytochrome c-type subunit